MVCLPLFPSSQRSDQDRQTHQVELWRVHPRDHEHVLMRRDTAHCCYRRYPNCCDPWSTPFSPPRLYLYISDDSLLRVPEGVVLRRHHFRDNSVLDPIRQVLPCSIWKDVRRLGPTSRSVEELFSARGPSSSAEVRGLVIQDIKEVEGVRQQEEQEDKRDEEIGGEMNGEVEEITHRAHET